MSSKILHSEYALFLHFRFKFHKILSNGYIYQNCGGPHNMVSIGICIRRCSIKLKKHGGNIFSNFHNSMVIYSNWIIRSTTMNKAKISLKKWNNSMRKFEKAKCIKSRNTTGTTICMRTWESWLFNPMIMHSNGLTQFPMFETIHWQI